jgi:ribonuclease HI
MVGGKSSETTCHAWTDGSFRRSAGLGWLITSYDKGAGTAVTQGARTFGDKQTAFDAEVAAIEVALWWFERDGARYQHMVVHSDSTSVIARVAHSGAGPGQDQARSIQNISWSAFPQVFIHYVGEGTRWGTRQ